MPPLRVQVLGGLSVEGVAPTALGSRKQRRLLARLVLARGAVVSCDELADDLWGQAQPARPRDDLSVLVSRLRSCLPGGNVPRRGAGYALELNASDLASLSALQREASGHAAAQAWASAAEATRSALDLVRGPVLPELADAPWVVAEQERVDRDVQQARLVLAQAQLELGAPRAAVDVADAAVTASPYDEVALRLHMRACLAARSPALGLASFAAARRRLADDLGADPSPETLAVHAELLRASAARTAPAQAPRTQYARTRDGVHIAYQVSGSGPVDVLFAVGLLSHVEHTWDFPGKAEFFQQVGAFSRLIRFDKRGSGMSDPVLGPVTLEERVEDMRAVLDAVGSTSTVLLGISEGGQMSLMFAATHPDRTRALVLYGTGARTSPADDYPWGSDRDATAAVIDLVTAGWGTPDGIVLQVLAPSLAQDAEARQRFADFERLASSPGQFAATATMNLDLDVRAVLPVLDLPTLVLHREEDLLFELGHGTYLAEHIRGAELVVLPGQDHMFWVQPDQITRHIEDFVSRLAPRHAPARRLAAVVSARPGSGATEAELLHQVVDREAEMHAGRVFPGDGEVLHVVLGGPGAAVRCAHGIAAQLRASGGSARCGVHVGPLDLASRDPDGRTLQAADSLSRLAAEHEVVASAPVRDLLAGSRIRFSPRTADGAGLSEVLSVVDV